MILSCEVEGVGEPLVLVHGFPLDRSMWTPLVERLRERCRIFSVDLRGLGSSPLPEGEAGRMSTMEAMADDIVETLGAEGVGGAFALAGLSMGGYVALAMLERHRARFRAVVLLDTRTAPDTPEAAQRRLELAEAVDEAGSARMVADLMTPRLFGPDATRDQPGLVAEWDAKMAAAPPRGVAAAARGMSARPDRLQTLIDAQLPTLLVVGEHDVITPHDEMKGIAAAVPGASFVAIPRSGHMPPLEQPDLCAEAIRTFLDRLA
ncbi:MAG: alpha/beta fold hydrolase [Planctomycetota bacterium]|nr:alpha/beta fold hydrolase [Planctomycetota bacterium]